jgi:hypothetical protein
VSVRQNVHLASICLYAGVLRLEAIGPGRAAMAHHTLNVGPAFRAPTNIWHMHARLAVRSWL